MVCVIKEEGGLGVIDLQIQNEALLLKHLTKFFNRKDIPWVALIWESYYESGNLPLKTNKGSFWWRDILKLLDKFKGMAMVNINNAKLVTYGQIFGMEKCQCYPTWSFTLSASLILQCWLKLKIGTIF